MKLTLDRAEADTHATRSTLLINGIAAGFILEPAGPGGVTDRRRVPAGLYALELKAYDAPRGISTSRFDAKAVEIMQQAGGQHFGMIRLVNVPGRSEILMHWGNFWSDSEGCLLTGRARMKGKAGELAVSNSREAYQRIYARVASAILNGGGASIEIVGAGT